MSYFQNFVDLWVVPHKVYDTNYQFYDFQYTELGQWYQISDTIGEVRNRVTQCSIRRGQTRSGSSTSMRDEKTGRRVTRKSGNRELGIGIDLATGRRK